MTDEATDTKCLRCNLNFTSAKTLKIHQLEKHAQGGVKCFKCGLRFTTQERFRVHWNNKHVTAPKTPVEPKPSSSSNGETVNLDEENESGSEKVSTDVTTKKRKHAMPTSNRCTVCFKAFASHAAAKLHYERVHLDWTAECEVCKKRVKKNLFIKVHLAKHRQRGEISVERILEIQKESQKRNHSKKSSKGELKVKVQPNVPTKCPDCLKVFISDRVMKIHWARTHYVKAEKVKSDKESDNSDAKDDSPAPEPKACPQCNKILTTDGRMRIHYYQAHVKKAVARQIRKKKPAQNGKAPCKTYESVKSVSDLRSKPPDIDFDSNVCPVCKKAFSTNGAARKHFKVVHRGDENVKCPHPQCFSRFQTVSNLRVHFSASHPKATLPKQFEPTRAYVKKPKLDDTKSTEGNKAEVNGADKNENEPEQSHQEDAKKSDNETKTTKPANPLLKMFEKMREKNAQCPVVPVKMATEVIEIDEDQGDDSGGCFTLDFEYCSVCSKKFLTEEAAMLHYNNKHPDEMQMCCECGMLVTSSRQMPYHFKTKHPSIAMPQYLKSSSAIGLANLLFDQFKLNRCTTCKLVFTSNVDAQKHFIEEHEVKFELCSICMRSFRSETTLLTHWAHRHENSKFVEFVAQTPMEVDDQIENATENDSGNAMASETEEMAEAVTENPPNETSKVDDSPTIDSDVPTSNSQVTVDETKQQSANADSKRKNRKIYPFITSEMCPVCSRYCLTRKATVTHYRTVHARKGIACQICSSLFANINHLKEHWSEIHRDEPWDESCHFSKSNDKENIDNNEVNIDSNKENAMNDKAPKMNVVVSLVNIKDNLDSLSPEIRKQFLEIMDNDNTDSQPQVTDNEEKVSEENMSEEKEPEQKESEEKDSGHGSTVDTTDEEISVNLSQNEPLDLSVPHERSPIDDLLDQTKIKCEPVNIKYESSDDLVHLQPAIFSDCIKNATLADDTNVVVKDEITFEEPTINE